MTRHCGLLVLAAACGGSPAPLPAGPEITMIRPAEPSAPAHDHARANQVLLAYGREHALGVERRAPTAAELAAAADADPVDDVSADVWVGMEPPMRMLHAYEAGQHVAWDAVCVPAVEAWWHAAKVIDDELAARLAQPMPSELYAGLDQFSQQRAWLAQRTKSDPAFSSLPQSQIGAYHRLAAAQLAWAETWRDRPVVHALAAAAVRDDGFPLDAVADEQARFCSATWLHTSRVWPPKLYAPIRISPPHTLALPARETGLVAKVSASGEELTVTRRDHETTIESVPPCKRVHCTGIDCAMDDRHGWRDICAQTKVHRTLDHAWTLHALAPPIAPKVGDHVDFYFDPASGNAVLASASRGSAAPSFTLTVF